MDQPSRMERMVGEIIGLRMLLTAVLENTPNADHIRHQAAQLAAEFPVRSDTPEGAQRIKACCDNMLKNFPKPMDKHID